jgi:succinate-semialdehyde dehydrogenase/glutarate-semialdehyde dehydrogenase
MTKDLLFNSSYVNGEWVTGSDKTFDVINPATQKVVASVADAGIELCNKAIDIANIAFKTWSKTTAKHRSVILEKWCALILENTDALAEIMTIECGKPIAESKGEVAYGASFIKWFAEEGKRVYGDVIPAHTQDRRLVVIKQAIGVVAAITPWNFPLAMITRKAGPALATGCTVVVRPTR